MDIANSHLASPPPVHVRPLRVLAGQSLVRWLFRISLMMFYRIRVHGLENYPQTDGALVCPNHQSNLDPLVLGVICPRPVNYLAKESLFKSWIGNWFFSWNDVIPIDRTGSGFAGMKETLRRLKRGESVVIFPEGKRSRDGELQPMMLGFCSLARRTSATLVPIGVEGTFQAMPPTSRFPRRGSIQVVIGPPIPFDTYCDLQDAELASLLTEKIQACLCDARRRHRPNVPATNSNGSH